MPQDYRFFLATVGNGGAGPFYGMEPLGTFDRNLSRPFPLTQPTDELTKEEKERFGDSNEYPGVLEFCHQGCAIYCYLVVNGPTYGTIWGGREDFYPTGWSFGVWYRRWVEHALRALDNEKLVPRYKSGCQRTTSSPKWAAVGEHGRRTIHASATSKQMTFRPSSNLMSMALW